MQNKEDLRIDLRVMTQEEQERMVQEAQTLYRLNHTMPYTEEYNALVCKLFGNVLGPDGYVMPGLAGVNFDRVRLGRGVKIMYNCLMMAQGGITIDDGAMIAANVQFLTNNHDLENSVLLNCKPVHICRNVWIGAGATILPGVTVGENAGVAAGAVVTKDVAPNTVVGGNPARTLKVLEPLPHSPLTQS